MKSPIPEQFARVPNALVAPPKTGVIFASPDMRYWRFADKGGVMKECFGKLYPDLSRIEVNKDLIGKVFRVRFVAQGMMRQPPQLNADLVEWEECRECEEYGSCYDFSNAKLAIRQALRNIP